MYYSGQGVPENNVEAVKWYRKAAEQGDIIAQSSLSSMYFYGEGVPENNIEAYAWALLAKGRWDEVAGGLMDEEVDEVTGELSESLETLEKRLTAEQRAEGQARAAELDRKIPRE